MTTKKSTCKRHIIINAGSDEGFVHNALLIKSKLADYHDDMNATNFTKPSRNRPSVIVMDNATIEQTMSDIRKWFEENNINFEVHCIIRKQNIIKEFNH